MIKFEKGTARVLYENAPGAPGPMVVDYRERFVVRRSSHDVLCYGLSLEEAMTMSDTGVGPCVDHVLVFHERSEFDHSAGKGKRPGIVRDEKPKKYFFTKSLGRANEHKNKDVL